MARYNEILVGRYARAIQKLFGMKGEVPVGSLAGELSIAHTVFNGAENRYLEGWEKFSASHFFAAAAAQNQGIQLRNPTGSNMIACVEKITLSTGVAQEMTVFRQFNVVTDLTTVATPLNLDSRGRAQPTMIFSFSNTTFAASGAIWDQLVPQNQPFDIIFTDIEEFPMLPGEVLQVETNTVNSNLGVCVWWRERLLEDSERT